MRRGLQLLSCCLSAVACVQGLEAPCWSSGLQRELPTWASRGSGLCGT